MNFLGLGLSQVVAIWSFIKATPWIWKLVVNYKDIQKILMESWIIFETCAKNKGVPSCEDSQKLLENIAVIFEKELIDLPNLHEAEFARMLREIKMNVKCELPKGKIG